MSEVVWEDPPPPRQGSGSKGKYAEFVLELRENPGKWALHPSSPWPSARAAGSAAGNVRDGRLVGLAKGEFEAAARTVDGEHRVYVRFVGDQP